ncbi:nucleotidyltransferase domain-containing protein [Candidatus Woesearchaeota archaeon]|nr:nucleotidyltransferase domain-containing protein [Candidatus Woesearchaeota archaeon]
MFKKLNILRIFFEEPSREFNVRETARILKISPATASKELKDLVKKGLLKERKERILNLYKSNLENDFYKDLKIFYNIRKIKDSKLIEELNQYYLKPAIVLFGSASRGEDTETSDFDLLIISEGKKEFTEKDKFEKKINRKLQLFVVKKIKELKNEHLINNILNGITIQGKVKWI